MREQMNRHVTMATPAPGFTMRVMERIREREQKAARRRSIAGMVLLALAAIVPLVILGVILMSAVSPFLFDPGLLISGLVALAPAFDIAGTVLDAVLLAAGTIVSMGGGQLLVYAIVVLALTLLWVRVAGGSFQLVPQTIEMGGS